MLGTKVSGTNKELEKARIFSLQAYTRAYFKEMLWGSMISTSGKEPVKPIDPR
jgi:hypothetical protein